MSRNKGMRLICLIIAFIGYVTAYRFRRCFRIFKIKLFASMSNYVLIMSVMLTIVVLIVYLIRFRIYKGFRYFWLYRRMLSSLERQFIDAGFSIRRTYFLELPKIQLSLSGDLKSGSLRIRNTLKFDKKLDDVVMSAALDKFIVERHYVTDDGNYYVYELVDGSVSFKQTFCSYQEFYAYSQKIPEYSLFLDNRSIVKLQHALIVGMTGSGKSYATYSLIMQMLMKNVEYKLYFADPKGSSLAVIGSAVAEERTVVDVDSIIEALEEFVLCMENRKAELKEKLKTRIDADYSDFGMTPYVFIFDEYASFASVIASEEKKVRDRVKKLLYNVVLQGRQLGFFLFIIMQKSDATLLDTALRENLPLKIVLGESEKQTYVTTFGAGVDIPNRHYLTGEGVFTEPVLAPEPKLVQFPYLNFDILKSIKTRGV